MSTIVYCDKCGKRIPAADLDAGRARRVDEFTMHCLKCMLEEGPAGPAEAPKETAEKRPPAAPRPALSRTRKIAGAAVVVGVMLGGLTGVMLLSGGDGEAPEAAAPAGEDREAAAPEPAEPPRPLAEAKEELTPGPETETSEAKKARAPAPRPTAAPESPETAAQAAFELADGFSADNPDQRDVAVALYRQVVKAYPGTRAAVEAEMRLLRLRNLAEGAAPASAEVAAAPEPAEEAEAEAEPEAEAIAAAEPQEAPAPPVETKAKPPAETKPEPVRRGATYDEALALAVGEMPLAEAHARIFEAMGELVEVDERWVTLTELARKAAAAEDAVEKHLAGKVGERVVVLRGESRPLLAKVASAGEGGVFIELAGRRERFSAGDLRVPDLQKFLGEAMEKSAQTNAKIAALVLLRGRPRAARTVHGLFKIEWRPEFDKILKFRESAALEAAAAIQVGRFEGLLEKKDRAAARKLGAEMLGKYGATRAVARMDPPLRVRLSELESTAGRLRGILLSDPKALPGGRFELNFVRSTPLHRFDLADRGLAARFVEIDAVIGLNNDKRWSRVFQLGDAVLTHIQKGGQRIRIKGKKHRKDHDIPTGTTPDPYKGSGMTRTYRIKAGPRGIAFQVDDGPVQTVNVPWEGGRLIWPGHAQIVPDVLKLSGRLDPLWVSEMSEVARDREKFLAGKLVEMRPRARRVVRPETEPWRNCYAYGADTEVRTLFGWHEVGASWTVHAGAWVSPRPTDGRKTWDSKIWPAALISRDAMLRFDAKIERGQLDVHVPTYYSEPSWRYRCNNEHVTIDPKGVNLTETSTFSSKPGHRKAKVHARGSAAPGRNRWRRYNITLNQGSVTVLMDGKLVLAAKVGKTGHFPMAFRVSSGSEVRLRSVRFRRAAAPGKGPPQKGKQR